MDVVIITAGRKALLNDCLKSILGWRDISIIVVVNGYDRDTVELLENLSRNDCRLRYTVNENKIPKSRARNIGLSLASAEIVYFIDDDACAIVDNGDVIRGKFSEYPEVAAIGGPNVTPASSSLFQRIAGYALSSMLIAWKMQKRYEPMHGDRIVDDRALILCNLALRRNILKKEHITFDERLEYNEENLLLQQLLCRGHKLLYIPEMVVLHQRRATLCSYARQVFGSGKGRGVMTILFPKSFMMVYALPTLFVAYLFCLPMASPVMYVPLLIYGLGSLLNAIYISIKKHEYIFGFVVLTLMPVISHVMYGTGFAWGVLQTIFNSKFVPEEK